MIQLTATKTDNNIIIGFPSDTAFPIQKEGRKNTLRSIGDGTKNGTIAPNIIKEDSFVTAIPSSLFEDIVTMRSVTMIPCKLPARDKNMISTQDNSVSLTTGRSIPVIEKANKAGSIIRDTKYPFLPRLVINRYLSI